MRKLIIVEGPDRCGKTTLAKHIVDRHDGVLIHASGYWTLHGAMQEYHTNLLDIAESALDHGHCVVMDRHWPSEAVYGGILRPNHHGHLNYLTSQMRQRIMRLGGIYVFCHSPAAITRQKMDQDPTHPYEDGVFSKIIEEYACLQNVITDGRVVKYCLEDNGSDLQKFCDLNDL